MSGQNTEKQILAMVILLVISVASLGAYVWFDNGRRTEATSEVFERDYSCLRRNDGMASRLRRSATI